MAKVVFTQEFIAITGIIKKEEIVQISNLNFHLKKLDKDEHTRSCANRKEIIKIEQKINGREKRKIIEKN